MITERHELCKGTGISIREVGDDCPWKHWNCIFWKPVHVA